MTETFDRTTLALQPGSPEAIRQAGAGLLWYLALCIRCAEGTVADRGQPFRDETERDTWAAKHLAGTGHAVRLLVDSLGELPELHLSSVISRAAVGDFRYLCLAPSCSVSNGPFPSPELAIASWRSHPVPA